MSIYLWLHKTITMIPIHCHSPITGALLSPALFLILFCVYTAAGKKLSVPSQCLLSFVYSLGTYPSGIPPEAASSFVTEKGGVSM
jgi:hypothetical protein